MEGRDGDGAARGKVSPRRAGTGKGCPRGPSRGPTKRENGLPTGRNPRTLSFLPPDVLYPLFHATPRKILILIQNSSVFLT